MAITLPVFTLAENARDWAAQYLERQGLDDDGDWDPRLTGSEVDAISLVADASEQGIISASGGWEVSLEFIDDLDGGSRLWFVTPRDRLFHLTSSFEDWRHITLSDRVGLDAAHDILQDAVTSANEVMGALRKLIDDATTTSTA